MPTTKPRVMLTLEISEYRALKRLSELQGRPMATVAAEFFKQCVPIFDEISAALEAVKRMEEAAPQDFLHRLQSAHDKAQPVLLDLLSALQECSNAGNRQA